METYICIHNLFGVKRGILGRDAFQVRVDPLKMSVPKAVHPNDRFDAKRRDVFPEMVLVL